MLQLWGFYKACLRSAIQGLGKLNVIRGDLWFRAKGAVSGFCKGRMSHYELTEGFFLFP
jgi:hypothetical protein